MITPSIAEIAYCSLHIYIYIYFLLHKLSIVLIYFLNIKIYHRLYAEIRHHSKNGANIKFVIFVVHSNIACCTCVYNNFTTFPIHYITAKITYISYLIYFSFHINYNHLFLHYMLIIVVFTCRISLVGLSAPSNDL